MNRSLLALLLLAILASATGCGRGTEGATAEKPAVAVDVVKVVTADQVDAIEVVGSLTPKFAADVKPEYQGICSQVLVSQWVEVQKGQPLAKLDTQEGEVLLQKAKAGLEAAKAGLLEAQVRQRQAEREHQRTVELRQVGLATQQSLDDATTAKEAAAAAFSAAQGQLRLAEEEVRHAQTRLDKAIVRAPMNGVIAERLVNPGDTAGEPGGSPAFRVVDNRILNLTVNVPASRVNDLAVGQELVFSLEGFPGRQFTGKVMFINPAVDEASRSVKVIAEYDNAQKELRGGLFARGRIVLGQRQQVLQAPRQALLNWDVDQSTAEVFVVEGNNARLAKVRLGRSAPETMEILSGLTSGQQVVARGGFNLKDGDKVKVAQTLGD